MEELVLRLVLPWEGLGVTAAPVSCPQGHAAELSSASVAAFE